ncbi:MAG: Tm-1-like ATP-binding domain-containing protein [Paludisphaera borealis]|uniref:Tm-1-like ATP-binding domain-containing protein n=1 Tax=Paludisphaera borealis TaxID=1387353 RepID=UPI00283CF510|nr:Tm-1-like ATP-binding domain-containing protein [Paludisphaera borealis]MDR3618544.1 Tm-1-like ATP-binding domain-containing protein [Paludisphaera borealis]
MSPSVYAIATMDTKGRELLYTAERLRSAGVSVVTVDVGTRNEPDIGADVSRQTVASFQPEDEANSILDREERGAAISSLSRALTRFLVAEHKAGKVAGVVGLGGSGGTALITPAMRALPVGLPKLMVSTVASGDTSPYVGCTDICMMYSVVDVAGLNTVLRTVLANAAHAMAGMVKDAVAIDVERPALGLTMFGLTTPCVTEAREELEPLGYDCLVFHATGTGGRAMEQLVASGLIQGLLDVTTTEVADFLVGGVFPCTTDRFEAQIAARIPCVMSLGALDMVNFGARATVPEKYRDRLFHQHNEQVTLMRTTVDENRRFGRWIGEKLNRWRSPISLLIPERGLSGLDAPGKPFHDPEADAALFNELEATVHQTADRTVRRFPLHINDPQFACQLVRAYLERAALGRNPK